MSVKKGGVAVALGTLATALSILGAFGKIYDVKSTTDQNKTEISALKNRTELDHDLIIRMSSDVAYIKDWIQEQKAKRQ